MKPIILFLEPDESGNVIIAKEEFQRLITETYEQGFDEGQNSKTYLNVTRDYSGFKTSLTPAVISSSERSAQIISKN